MYRWYEQGREWCGYMSTLRSPERHIVCIRPRQVYASAEAPYVSYSAFRNAVDKGGIQEVFFLGPRTVAFRLKVPVTMPSVTQPPTGYEKIVNLLKRGGEQGAQAPAKNEGAVQERAVFKVSLPRCCSGPPLLPTASLRACCSETHLWLGCLRVRTSFEHQLREPAPVLTCKVLCRLNAALTRPWLMIS